MTGTSGQKTADIDYSGYLALDKILSAQYPVSGGQSGGSPAHDEMLFIITHQTYELWFKLALFEMDRVQALFAKKTVEDSDLRTISASLARMNEIMKLLIRQIDVLETMAPLDFLEFRHVFRSASGFQSLQFRLLEIRLGLDDAHRVAFGEKSMKDFLPDPQRTMAENAEQEKSLLRQVDEWLSRTPFVDMGGYRFWDSYNQAIAAMLASDRAAILQDDSRNAAIKKAELKKIDAIGERFSAFLAADGTATAGGEQWRLSKPALQAALFILLYRDQPVLQLPYQILGQLMDMDECLTLWRFRHTQLAERMLGRKSGSGGSSGADYLRATTEKHRIFSDFFLLTTFLIPRSALPPLPDDVAGKMGFAYSLAHRGAAA